MALVQHYQRHLETIVPGLNSDITASTACWLSELVANLFGTKSEHVLNGIKFLDSRVFPISASKWALARSRSHRSKLRNANLYNPFIWADGLVTVASQSISRLPSCGFTDTLRFAILQRLATALPTGGLITRGVNPAVFTFSQPISQTNLGLTDNETSADTETAVRAFFAARAVMEDKQGIRNILLDLRNCEPLHCHFLCDFLRSSNVDKNDPDNVVPEFLNDDDWRRSVFDNIPEISLDRLVSFLIDWQMQCDDEWLIRIPNILAHDCERTTDREKQSLLFTATLMSSLASDVVNPIIRLIAGEKREQFAEVAKSWRYAIRPLSLKCEPWVASRIRGVLGTLESHMN